MIQDPCVFSSKQNMERAADGHTSFRGRMFGESGFSKARKFYGLRFVGDAIGRIQVDARFVGLRGYRSDVRLRRADPVSRSG